jgi:hypothetical protein
MKTGFFAYSSNPTYSGEFVEEAIKTINSKGVTKIQSWTDLGANGKFIIKQILVAIEKADYFCADLTGIGDNVLFELGFAISKRKQCFIILDTSHSESVKRFKEFNLLSNVGYSPYSNSKEIITEFENNKPFESTTPLIATIPIDIKSNEKVLFYLKGQVDTNYSQEILNLIENEKLPYTLDDPVESKSHPLSWYLSEITSTPALLAEFSSMQRFGHELHNSKCSFIAGMAVGLDLKILMVAEQPYPTAFDYQEYLRKYENRQTCREVVSPFVSRLKDDIASLLFKKRAPNSQTKERSNLQKVNFGEYIAEHENENLYDYFVETSHYDNLIKSEHNIVIGRKGTGKTATFYFLNEEFGHDVRNHICLIKPINFEIDGLVALYKSLDNDFEKGYLTESIWKFLIYTEVAKSLYLKIKNKPIYSIVPSEAAFMSFVETIGSIILSDFSTRLEQEIEKLRSDYTQGQTQQQFKIKISEILHDDIITPLKVHFKSAFLKTKKLIVLIDNLDKSWRTGSDIEVLSKFILGLLGTVGRISTEFKGKPQDTISYTFHMVLFLRSDIFKYVMTYAREPDKIEFSRMRWNDLEVFFRVIETRFNKLSKTKVEEDLWDKYFVKLVEGESIKTWIFSKILPRPRDVIYLLNVAKNFAVSRGHSKIDEVDMISAHKDYSSWVFKSVIVENGITVLQMENFMYQLMGENVILKNTEIKMFAEKAGIENLQLDKFSDHLVSLSVLGREVADNKFDFEYEFDGDKKLKTLAGKFNSNRFRLHEALVPYLESKRN